MQFPSESYLEQLRKKYPVGTKLQLISMRNEKYPVLSGTLVFAHPTVYKSMPLLRELVTEGAIDGIEVSG